MQEVFPEFRPHLMVTAQINGHGRRRSSCFFACLPFILASKFIYSVAAASDALADLRTSFFMLSMWPEYSADFLGVKVSEETTFQARWFLGFDKMKCPTDGRK